MNLKITDLLDDYLDGNVYMDPVPVPDTDRIKEAAMKRIKKQRTVRPLRVALIAAAVVALLTGTVLGAYAVRHWDEILVQYFGVEDSTKELLDETLEDIDVSGEADGCTFTIKQIMGDKHCMVVSLDIQLPADVTLPVISTEELKAVSAENGYAWNGVVNRLHSLYSYEETDESFVGGAYLTEPLLFPVKMDEEALMAESNAYLEDHPDNLSEAMNWVLYNKALEEFGADPESGEGTSFGGGIIYSSYDPETNTLSALINMHTENDIVGKPCTLVLDGLYTEDVLAVYSTPSENAAEDQEARNLLTKPLVLNFTADYTPQGRNYDIQENGVSIGTLELSPFSAFATFPLEPDDTEYSSLEQAALAPSRTDYLEGAHEITVTCKDGTTGTYHFESGGIGYAQTIFAITDQIIDMEQIETIALKDYTIVPLQ